MYIDASSIFFLSYRLSKSKNLFKKVINIVDYFKKGQMKDENIHVIYVCMYRYIK